jgi:hypothetical protein
VDAVTLDRLIEELRPSVEGRHLSRPRLGPPGVVTLEVSGMRGRRLWLDAGRGTAGLSSVARDEVDRLLALGVHDHPGRARQMLLHLRKHVDGARALALRRVSGERTVLLETSAGTLVLRLSGPAPALTLARDGEPLGTAGDGPEAWPPPPESPEREWDRLEPRAFEEAVESALARGRTLARAVLAACPGLGPALARQCDGSASSLLALRDRLRSPRPSVACPAPPDQWHDADLGGDAVLLAPVPLDRPGVTVIHPASWVEASALYVEGRHRGVAFERCRKRALGETRRTIRRLEQLLANLERDLEGVADEARLRREAAALLAWAARLELSLDPVLGGVANAERRFERARRAARARHQIELRRRETRSSLDLERRRESGLLEARDLAEVGACGDDTEEPPSSSGAAPRRYLTSRGLDILVGRHARENHHLTFKVARPEDLWLHARDVPGSHVILRDNEGRAGALDLREAAEVAAFFSEARGEAHVDVHATRRKHLRPARGGPGRVFIGHSETLRVVPRDPEGRLRRR